MKGLLHRRGKTSNVTKRTLLEPHFKSPTKAFY